MTSTRSYQWVLSHVLHAISRDVIRNFHTLFHTCIHTLRDTFRIPTYEVLFRMNSAPYGILKSLGILLLSHDNDILDSYEQQPKALN